jgi:hypothetical protein
MIHFEVQVGGDDSNGGGFRQGASGTDYSQQTSPQATLTTNSVINSSVNRSTGNSSITASVIDVDTGDYTVSAADIGNVLQISGGTATAGWYEIVAVDVAANQWTLNRSAGSVADTLSGKMGGCLGTLGILMEILDNDTKIEKGYYSGDITQTVVWFKSGTYNITTATPGRGGPINIDYGGSAATAHGTIEGYYTTRGDLYERSPPKTEADVADWPIFSANSITITNMFDIGNNSNNCMVWRCLGVDGTNTTTYGFNTAATIYRGTHMDKCYAKNCSTAGFNVSESTASACLAFSNQNGFYNRNIINHCRAFNNTDVGIYHTYANCTSTFCLAYNNGGIGIDCGTALRSTVHYCTSFNNTGAGFDIDYNNGHEILYCLAVNNGGTGFVRNYYLYNAKGYLVKGCVTYNNQYPTTVDQYTGINYRPSHSDDFTEVSAAPISSGMIPNDNNILNEYNLYAGAEQIVITQTPKKHPLAR